MDVYEFSSPDLFRIDDLLDFSNEALFSSSSSSNTNSSTNTSSFSPTTVSAATFTPTVSTDFADELCVPRDDVAELEWLSHFVDDSIPDFSPNYFIDDSISDFTRTLTVCSDTSFSGGGRIKRSEIGKQKTKERGQRQPLTVTDSELRRCTHCASDKTPQWRTGPLGPKTLCNACGVRYKSGRLVPEYRPAASPTFMLTQHSNSHRKVMELRRQKEARQQNQQMVNHHQQQQQQQEEGEQQIYSCYRNHNYEVC